MNTIIGIPLQAASLVATTVAMGAWLLKRRFTEPGGLLYMHRLKRARQASSVPPDWTNSDWYRGSSEPGAPKGCDVIAKRAYILAAAKIKSAAGELHLLISDRPRFPDEIIVIEKIPMTASIQKTGALDGGIRATGCRPTGYRKLIHFNPMNEDEGFSDDLIQTITKAVKNQTPVDLKFIGMRGGYSPLEEKEPEFWTRSYLCPVATALEVTPT